MTDNSDGCADPGPILVFVLGPPCAGKSTLCTTLAKRYSQVDHFSIGNELRELVSPYSTGIPALIKSDFTDAELKIIAQNLKQGTLTPVHLTLRYVEKRIFFHGKKGKDVRILIDGFPRHLTRWDLLKKDMQGAWEPGKNCFAIIMNIERNMAQERYTCRGRPGDVFDRRFDDFHNAIGGVVEAMKQDGVTVIELSHEDILDVDRWILNLCHDPTWSDVFGAMED